MKGFLLLLACLLASSALFAQTPKPLYKVVDTNPTLPNGENFQAAYATLVKRTINRKNISPALKDKKHLFVTFLVDSLGYLRNIRSLTVRDNRADLTASLTPN